MTAILVLLVIAGAGALWLLSRSPRGAPSGLEPVTVARKAPADPACERAYDQIYGGQPILFRIVFGYKDTRPARFVGDRYERNALVAELLKPCPPGRLACGFRRAEGDGELLLKEIRAPRWGVRQIRLEVVHSSAGPDDEENRGDPLQRWRSRHAEAAFLEGMKEARVVLYDGHSRDGGGPDFGPPRLTKGHVDYYWYQLRQPGLERMLSHLKESPRPPKILGLFSCVSTGHFASRIREAAPALGLVTSSQLLYYIDAFRSLIGTLEALLSGYCEQDFQAAVGAGEGSRLENFFGSD